MSASTRQDDGFAMIAVIGIVALITVVAVGGFFISSVALDESERVVAETRAFQVAQSGLDSELAVFDSRNVGTGFYPRQGSTDDGEYIVEVVAANEAAHEYEMTVTGEADERTESVTLRFFLYNLWDMNIGAGDSATIQGGRGWNGQGTITGPLYTRGDVHLGANSHYETGPMFIYDGDLIFDSGSAGMGENDPVDLFLTGSIQGGSKDVHLANVYSTVPNITLPWIEEEYMEFMHQRAIDESTDNILGSDERRTIATFESSAGDPATYDTALDDEYGTGLRSPIAGASDYYKAISNGASIGALGAGTHSLTINSTSFGAWEGNGYPLASELHDDFAFNSATGTLYVEGTVFIDGDLTLGTNVNWYVGNGTLVVNGDVVILGYLKPVGGLAMETALGIATPGDLDIGPRVGGYNSSFTGAIFANGEVGLYGSGAAAHSTTYTGSILCGNIYGDMPNIELTTDPTGVLVDALPESLPAANGVLRFDGDWSRQ